MRSAEYLRSATLGLRWCSALRTISGRRALKAVAAVRGFGCDMDRDNNDDAASHESEEF